MFFVLIITFVFVVVSIYFFFRAEKLQRQLISQKRDVLATSKENKVLVDSLTLIATRGQEFAKQKLEHLKVQAKECESEQLIIHLELISPLINNYSIIFRECLKGRGRLKAVSKKCFENHDSAAFKKFVALIVTGDKRLKRYWSSDNLNGFLFLVDALLTADDSSVGSLAKNKKSICIP
ncbi:hypothetical protein [Colwellia psychrerythraea]|uniref:Uncharacterized protein n=1 Tax=Colwellia psychrerythraea TaxID=28229 RepID=A0A099KNE3_COLPS|nr:hypothetical protein [Colwellia psychrerythraea]KGJ91123.1 hypothetical protein GAB14E_3275 [Colwellia psychrerythraea]